MLISQALTAAIVPMLLYLYFIWYADRYEREPLTFVLLHFLWGALGASFLTIFLNKYVTSLYVFLNGDIPDQKVQVVLIAPVLEEILKALFLVLTISSRKFDNITDGLVYGSAIGLGFGMTENFLYFFYYGNVVESWIYLVIMRTAFSAVMHAIATASFGAFLSMAKFNLGKVKFKFMIVAILIPITIHVLWNASALFTNTIIYGIIFMIIIISTFIYLFRYSLKNELRIIRTALEYEAQNNILPIEHVDFLSSNKRDKSGWIDESIRKTYIKYATKLAFRSFQYEHTNGKRKEFYLSDKIKYQERIKNLLNEQGGNI